MPSETHASIGPSFLPPPPDEKVVGPSLAEPAPGNTAPDWTTSGQKSMDEIRAGATTKPPAVAPAVQQIRREAEGG